MVGLICTERLCLLDKIYWLYMAWYWVERPWTWTDMSPCGLFKAISLTNSWISRSMRSFVHCTGAEKARSIELIRALLLSPISFHMPKWPNSASYQTGIVQPALFHFDHPFSLPPTVLPLSPTIVFPLLLPQPVTPVLFSTLYIFFFPPSSSSSLFHFYPLQSVCGTGSVSPHRDQPLSWPTPRPQNGGMSLRNQMHENVIEAYWLNLIEYISCFYLARTGKQCFTIRICEWCLM